jgi:membrane protein
MNDSTTNADPTDPSEANHDYPENGERNDDDRVEDDSRNAPPSRPAELSLGARLAVLFRVVREANDDALPDWAASLTYYSVLSMFPGLLLLAAVLGLVGESATKPLLDNLSGIAPGPAQEILTASLRNLTETPSAAGPLAIAGLLGALWSTSGYVGAFMRASNVIYDVPEGRPIWMTLPIRLVVTVIVGVILAASALIVVFTGELAKRLGRVIGLGDTAVTIWSIAKWPMLVLLVSLVFALLYWASPNAKQAGFRWITPGGLLAVVLWLTASFGFALYVTNFASYNKTYGALGGIIVFLVWLWISNLAILLGAELDAELHRARAIAAGHPKTEEPYVALRDTRKLD